MEMLCVLLLTRLVAEVASKSTETLVGTSHFFFYAIKREGSDYFPLTLQAF